MNKRVIKTLIIIWSIIAVGFTAILVYAICNNNGGRDILNLFISHGSGFTLTVQKDENMDINNINKINVDFTSSNIVVQTTNEPNMRVVQKSTGNLKDDQKFTITKDGDEVTIKKDNLGSHFNIFNFGNFDETIEVYIPKNYNKDLDIESSSGNIQISTEMKLESVSFSASSGNLDLQNSINADDINLKVSSGNISIEDLICKTYNIETSSGNTKVKSISGSGFIKASSGNIKVNYKDISEYSNVSAHSGNVNLVVPKECSFEFSGKCSSGDIKSNFDLNYKSKSKDEATAKIGSGPYKKIDASTNSGNISISN